MKWRKARKKPIVIEFREVEPIHTFGGYGIITEARKGERIKTKEGELLAIVGEDFIIKGIEGEEYPIKKDIFFKTYEVLENEL